MQVAYVEKFQRQSAGNSGRGSQGALMTGMLFREPSQIPCLVA